MLTSSLDILWLALALVVLLIGVSLTWCIVYLALILRDFKKTTKSLRKKLDILDSILEIIKNKVEKTANYLPPLIEGGIKLAQHFQEKKDEDKPKKKKK